MKATGVAICVGAAILAAAGPVETQDVRSGYSSVTVQILGEGRVTPSVEGKLFKNGKFLMLTPKPAAGYVFAGWDDYYCLMCNTFVVEPGLTVVANFIPNPFTVASGEYNGLFFEATNSLVWDRAGSFSLKLNPTGKVSGSLRWQGKKLAITDVGFNEPEVRGGLGVGWNYNLDFYRGNPMDGNFRRIVSGRLHLDFTNPKTIDGKIWDAYRSATQTLPPSWEAGVTGVRNPFNAHTNAAPFSRNYTVAFLRENPGFEMAGFGFARVGEEGRLSFNGKTVRGDSLAQQTALGVDGQWALYASIQQGRGGLIGWLTLESGDAGGPRGRPILSRFGGESTAPQSLLTIGSPFQPPGSGKLPLNLTNAAVVFTGPHFIQPLTNAFFIASSGMISNVGKHRFATTFNRATGGFSGSLREQPSGRKFTFQGVVLQNQNVGRGFYVGPDGQMGWVLLSES